MPLKHSFSTKSAPLTNPFSTMSKRSSCGPHSSRSYTVKGTVQSNATPALFATPVLRTEKPSPSPTSTDVPTVCRERTTSRAYRCSRCGKRGHNVRSCPKSGKAWFRQRCSRCGEYGHNARTCPHTERVQCNACSGTQKILCPKCNGCTLLGQHMIGISSSRQINGYLDEPVISKHGVATRLLPNPIDKVPDVLRKDPYSPCSRCIGKGYLKCEACSSTSLP